MPNSIRKFNPTPSLRYWTLAWLLVFAASQLHASSHVHLDDDGDFACAICLHADHTLAAPPSQAKGLLVSPYAPHLSHLTGTTFQPTRVHYLTRAPPKH